MQAVSFLKVRKAQLLHELKALGFLYSLFLISGSVIAAFVFYKTQTNTKNVLYGLLALTFVVFSIHISRSDHRFISLISEKPFLIFLIEYGAFVMPFILLSIVGSGKIWMVLIMFPIVLISKMKKGFYKEATVSVIGNYVPSKLYEWKAGLRRVSWIFILLWLAALVLVFIPFVSILILWVMLMMVSGFYDHGESRDMIEGFRLNAGGFLVKKFVTHILMFQLFAVPVLLINLFIYPDKWWVVLLFLLFSCVNIMVFISSKYAVWQHAENNFTNSILNTICMIGLILPFLLPLPIIVLVRNYRKALLNLKPLLDDYH